MKEYVGNDYPVFTFPFAVDEVSEDGNGSVVYSMCNATVATKTVRRSSFFRRSSQQSVYDGTVDTVIFTKTGEKRVMPENYHVFTV